MEEKQEQPVHKWLIALSMMTGSLMVGINGSIVNVALPQMRGYLGASVEEIAWVPTGFILSSVIIMPIVAMLSSRFGRKRFLLFSASLFALSSMCCGLAWNLESLIFFRVLQGIGGGPLMPLAQAILRETFPPREQAKAMGIYGFGVILGPAFAPTLGGWITDNYSWQWVFFVNVPMAVLNLILVTRFIKDPPYLLRETGRIDFSGLFFLCLGLGALQIMLQRGQQKDWFASNLIVYLAIIAAVGLFLFIRREWTTEKPAVNIRMLKDLNFATGTVLVGFLGVAFMGGLFVLPLLLQQLLRYPAFDSGLAVLPRSMAMAVAMPLSGRLYNRTGPKWLIGTGLFLVAFSFFRFSRLSLMVGFWDIVFIQLMQGIGFGAIFVSLSTATLSTIDRPQMTTATGLYNVTQQVAGSFGIAMTATLLSWGQTRNRSMLIQHINVFKETASGILHNLSSYFFSKGMDQAGADQLALKSLEGIVSRQSAMMAYNYIHFLLGLLFLLAIVLAFIIKDKRLADFKKAI
ncbi:MAG: DHA2 family efflux MFS transporter permease subunit [Thermodesulfobacteriota bacterium]